MGVGMNSSPHPAPSFMTYSSVVGLHACINVRALSELMLPFIKCVKALTQLTAGPPTGFVSRLVSLCV